MNITVSVGLHFQLTKRTGRTKHELRREAKNLVFGDVVVAGNAEVSSADAVAENVVNMVVIEKEDNDAEVTSAEKIAKDENESGENR